MNGIGLVPRISRTVLIGLAAATVASAWPATAEAVPFADACGATRESSLAKAFGLSEADTRSTAIREPGNSAGVLRIRCDALAWNGRKPSSPEQERLALASGTAASLRIATWVPDEGALAENWRRNFADTVAGLTSRAKRLFIEGSLGGRRLALPRFSRDHALGFIATTGALTKVRAFWWSASKASIVSVNVTTARGKPAVGSLKQVAQIVVPAIE